MITKKGNQHQKGRKVFLNLRFAEFGRITIKRSPAIKIKFYAAFRIPMTGDWYIRIGIDLMKKEFL